MVETVATLRAEIAGLPDETPLSILPRILDTKAVTALWVAGVLRTMRAFDGSPLDVDEYAAFFEERAAAFAAAADARRR